MGALSTRPEDHGDQKQAGMISFFSFTRGFRVLVGAVGTVLRNSPDAQLISEGPARVTQNGKSYSGKMAVMTMQDFRAKSKPSRKRPKGISDLRLFRLGEYFIKYRMAYSEAIRGKAEKEIKGFMISLKWPSEES